MAPTRQRITERCSTGSLAYRARSRAQQTSRTPAPTHLGAGAAAAPRGAAIPGSNLGAVGRCPRALASVRREVSDAGKRLVRSPLLLLLRDLGIPGGTRASPRAS